MFERFTDRARRVVVLAQEEARGLNNAYIGTEHILLGLIREGEGVAAKALESMGISRESVRNEVAEIVGKGLEPPTGYIPFTPRAKKVLELSLREALQLGHKYIGTEHILLGLIREGEGVAAQVLVKLGAELTRVRQQVIQILSGYDQDSEGEGGEHGEPTPMGAAIGSGGDDRPVKGKNSTVLDQFGRNLTAEANQGRLDPVVGREKEIKRIMQVLVRRTKNNPVLIGEPGVGKSAVVEGLAQLIADNKVPEMLRDKQLYMLDLSSMVAGSRYRGDFEERMKKVLKEVHNRGDIILFIDEIHTLVGAGAAEGAIDAASILKPKLARGELQVVGATTIDEYRKHIEKDAALERRFQPIKVEEPSVEETIEIVRGLRKAFEDHHHCHITDEAIRAAATLSDRYLPDRFQPDKTIDIIDEAGAMMRVDRLTAPSDVVSLEEELLKVRRQKESAIDNQDFETAASLRDLERQIQEKHNESEREWREEDQSGDHVLTEELIAQIVSDWTGVPVFKMSTDEASRLVNMEKVLHNRIIGQEDAVKAVSRAIRRTRAGLKDPRRPSGSFIFAGPSGVGKTELSKALADFLFGDEKALITIDMSEYQERFAVSRLFGAPPGYVGFEEGGQLTEKVRRQPFSVVLFDEIEKAHPDVNNSLLQVLDEGRLTDGQGRVIDFKNTVLIFTSNLGTGEISKAVGMGFSASGAMNQEAQYERMKDKVNEALKKHFRPEFLNRIDDIVVFHQLSEQNILELVDLLVSRVTKVLADKKISLELTPLAKKALAKRGFDPVLGARPLRRTIQRDIEDQLSERLLFEEIHEGQKVIVDVENWDGESKPTDVKFTFTGQDWEPPAQPEVDSADSPEHVGAGAYGRPSRGGLTSGSAGYSDGTQTAAE